ncbi:MAG: 4-hydroxythreonine-4-phosphate dehydrogenase PdxA [Proteobacteria bacterium]|nr:4-hydroxythreonine-4-phosphate dehydrogenase PdxA [Pseudomonadota bacterium]
MKRNTIKSTLAITMGDPVGISPEIISKNLAWAAAKYHMIIFGHWPSLERALESAGSPVEVNLAGEPSQPDLGGVTVVHCGPDDQPINTPDARSSLAQFAALERAVDAVTAGACDALVTAPLSKKLVAKSSPGFSGHTEYLAHRAHLKSDDVTMVFASTKLAVGLVSTHIPMREVPAALKRPYLERTLCHLKQMLIKLHPGRRLRIGVAALNPHAGEGGMFGSEEREIIAPFCHSFTGKDDVEVVGPLPADSLFRDAIEGHFHGVISAYHDQAMIPLKLFGIGQTVNVTMGLPFIRTSPDHGVAYDIAHLHKADPSGMKLAIELAAELATQKQETD